MVFITPCCTRQPSPLARLMGGLRLVQRVVVWLSRQMQLRLPSWVLMSVLCCALAALCLPNAAQAQESRDAEVRQLQVRQSKEGLLLNASVGFKLGAALQDALSKGVPLHFVAQADIQRDRWYWWDEEVKTAKRMMRLSYAPLTRRWRVAVQSGSSSDAADINLNLNFNSQEEALAAVRNIGSWRIADAALLSPGERYNINFKFYLDLSQLPKPFQIGLDAQSDWKIEAAANARPVAVTPTP